MGRNIRKNCGERSNTQRVMRGNCHVMFAALPGRKPEMTTCLAGHLIA